MGCTSFRIRKYDTRCDSHVASASIHSCHLLECTPSSARLLSSAQVLSTETGYELEVVDMTLQHVSPWVLAVPFASVSAAACDSLEWCCKARQALPAELECEENMEVLMAESGICMLPLLFGTES